LDLEQSICDDSGKLANKTMHLTRPLQIPETNEFLNQQFSAGRWWPALGSAWNSAQVEDPRDAALHKEALSGRRQQPWRHQQWL